VKSKSKYRLTGPELAAMFNELPLERLLRRQNDETVDDDTRDALAIASMKFVHPSLAVAQLVVQQDTRTPAMIAAEIASLLQRVQPALEHRATHVIEHGNRRDLIGVTASSKT
jgi:hypothetical protein